MLRGDEDALDLDGRAPSLLVDLVADGDLRLPVGPQVREDVGLPHLGEALRDLVREHDRERHQLRRLVRRVAEHEALVAGADAVERVVVAGLRPLLEGVVDALGDVGRLLVERDDDAAGLGVEPVLRAGVADRGDPLADEPRDVDVGLGRDLAGHDHEARGDERLARDPPARVGGEDGVEDGVGDLVGDLVGVPFGHRLRREGERARGDRISLPAPYLTRSGGYARDRAEAEARRGLVLRPGARRRVVAAVRPADHDRRVARQVRAPVHVRGASLPARGGRPPPADRPWPAERRAPRAQPDEAGRRRLPSRCSSGRSGWT